MCEERRWNYVANWLRLGNNYSYVRIVQFNKRQNYFLEKLFTTISKSIRGVWFLVANLIRIKIVIVDPSMLISGGTRQLRSTPIGIKDALYYYKIPRPQNPINNFRI